MKSIGFYKTNILLPKENLEKWSTLACDQFTSDLKYWEEVKEITRGYPSAYNIIFPEAYLGKINFNEKINEINLEMKEYLKNDIFEEYKNSILYIERTLLDGSIRKGLVGALDLEEYNFNVGADSLIRATEGTVVDRLPPRVKVREKALVEMPHILVLIDDEKKEVIEYFSDKKEKMKKIYSFNLMKEGGHIEGFLLREEHIKIIENKLLKLIDKEYFDKKYNLKDIKPFLFAMGDGNHSLATAKECYEKLKNELGEEKGRHSLARFALVEINNLHDDSLKFQGIHRLVFNVDENHFMRKLEEFCLEKRKSQYDSQNIILIKDKQKIKVEIKNPKHNLAVGSVQIFLEDYLEKFGGKVDYIHGDEEIVQLSKNGKIGIMLKSIKKSELFKSILLNGVLPKKTFSMGEAREKRYYLEARKIK
ncbi:MAG: DUF1015 domain-containing protein [Fusobacterium sp.]